MRLPKDKKTRINIYFISPFILIGLIFGGLNLYKNLHYSTFSLAVSKDYPLSQSPDGFIATRASIAPTSHTKNQTTYSHLHTYWWADHTHIYTLGSPDSGLWFRVHSTLKGNFYLIPGDWGSRAAVVGLNVVDKDGNVVNDLQPGKWYEVEQYGQLFKLKLSR